MASDTINAILLFGIPGSGKGTQGAILGRIPGFVHLAMGDVFRGLDRTSALGKKFLEYSTRGELVPDDLTVQIWREHVDGLVAAGRFRPQREFLVLDGIPRSATQARVLAQHVTVKLVLHLVAQDQDQMVERMRKRALEQQRPDDADERVIRRRFAVYAETTEPVLRSYAPSLIRDVEATGTPAHVLFSILEAVVPLQEECLPNPLGA